MDAGLRSQAECECSRTTPALFEQHVISVVDAVCWSGHVQGITERRSRPSPGPIYGDPVTVRVDPLGSRFHDLSRRSSWEERTGPTCMHCRHLVPAEALSPCTRSQGQVRRTCVEPAAWLSAGGGRTINRNSAGQPHHLRQATREEPHPGESRTTHPRWACTTASRVNKGMDDAAAAATAHAARAWTHPPLSHSKNQSCVCLDTAFGGDGFPECCVQKARCKRAV